MFCCVCNGSCNHVGPHSYCGTHGGNYTIPITYTTTTSNVMSLSDADIERIADRVVAKLEQKMKVKRKK